MGSELGSGATFIAPVKTTGLSDLSVRSRKQARAAFVVCVEGADRAGDVLAGEHGIHR